MKCPDCGNEIQDGHLICEVCGYEVMIVPDFEPDIEPQIDNHVVGVLIEDNAVDAEERSPEDILSDTLNYELGAVIRHKIMRIVVLGLIAVMIIALAVWFSIRFKDPEHQLNNARNLAAQGKYEDAISALENMYVSNPDVSAILFLESDYYQELDKNDQAVDTLKRLISSGTYSEEDVYSAYDRLINIYVSTGDYHAIAQLLDECEYPGISQAYQNYVAFAPVFSYEGGTYDNAIRLKISSNTSGEVYYTLDGSVPNESSEKYTAPIMLDHGDYTVSAIFINQYGIISDMVTAEYTITNDIPDEPVVNADSGEYHKPVLIKVEVPEGCKVYYTTDKSIPTEDSVPYIDPIPMPVNYSNFSFVAISEDGLTSDVVIKSYSLTFPDGIPLEHAVNLLKTRLIERGLLNDMNGKSDRAPGRYTYEVISAISLEGQGDYYTVAEFYHDGSGTATTTGTRYIVEIHQGSTALLGGDAVNGFVAIAF